MADRRTLLVLSGIVLLVVALFLLGVLGPGRAAPPGAWPDWAAPQRARGDPLLAEDLRADPSCEVAGTVITLTGTCAVQVRPVTGGFGWERVTRRAILTAVSQPVGLTVTLAGRTLHDDLDPGDGVRLTYTREGGEFVLRCAAPTGCVVALTEDA
jgi:hypothetical protein